MGAAARLRGALSAAVLCTTLGAGAMAGAAEPGPWPPAGAAIVDRLVAIVNTEPITHFELRRASMPFIAKAVSESNPSELRGQLQQVQAEVLDNLINDLLVYAEAKKLGLTVTPDRVDTHLGRIRDANGWSDDELAHQLRKLGFASISDYRRHTEREMLKSQAISIKVGSRVKVDDKAVEAEIKRRLGETRTVEERRAAHILLAVDAMATDASADATRARLEAIGARIAAGETSFEEAARKYSEDPGTSPAGGDLGWFVRGDFDPDFEDAAFEAPKGTVSAPVRTQFGWHIIKIVGVRDRKVTGEADIEKMRREISFKQRQQELERLYTQWVRGLRAQAFIEVTDARFRLPTG